MYESFFGMEHTPFARDVPPESLYESENVSDILGRLAYVADRQLFAVLTADAGCGKSTLIRKFTASLNSEEYIMLYLSDSKLTPRWFYKGLLDQIGIEAKFYRGDAKRQLQREIEIIRGVQKKKVVCILDEAHLLEKETLEEFRFLLNYQGNHIVIYKFFLLLKRVHQALFTDTVNHTGNSRGLSRYDIQGLGGKNFNCSAGVFEV